MRRLAAPLLALLAGCGTITNFIPLGHYSPPRRVYGGVRQDAENLGSGTLEWWLYPCQIIDLPLSAVGDTLTLPILLLTPASERRPPPDPEEFRGRFVFRLEEGDRIEEARAFLRTLPGVLDAGAWRAPDDPARHFIEARFDPSLTDRSALAARLREKWRIAWWECAPCGRTASVPGDCCLGAMRPGAP